MTHTGADLTDDLLRYLGDARRGLLDRVVGLSEYDLRRPLTPTGTNLLGLVKHLTGIEYGYLGDSVGRPAPVGLLPWVEDGSVWQDADMWATEDQRSDELIELYRGCWQHSDASVRELGLEAPAVVAWWPAQRQHTTLGSLLVRVVAETAQHAGHADIIRELIDGRAGAGGELVADPDLFAKVRRVADAFLAE